MSVVIVVNFVNIRLHFIYKLVGPAFSLIDE